MLRLIQRFTCGFAMLGLLAAAKLQPIPVDAVAGWNEISPGSQLVMSSNARYVAFVVRNDRRLKKGQGGAAIYDRRGVPVSLDYACDIYVADLLTGSTENITAGVASNWGPNWAPNGKQLAFYSDRDGFARVWLWTPHSRSLRRISAVKIMGAAFGWAQGPIWADGGRTLIVPTLPYGQSFASETRLQVEGKNSTHPYAAGSSVHVYEYVRGHNGETPEGRYLQGYEAINGDFDEDLSAIDIAHGTTRIVLHHFKGQIAAIDRKRRYLIQTSRAGAAEGNSLNTVYNVRGIDLQDGSTRFTMSRVPMFYGTAVSWSPVSDAFAYIESAGAVGSRAGERPSGKLPHIVIVNVSAHTMRRITPRGEGVPPEFEPNPPQWSPDGSTLFVIGELSPNSFAISGRTLWRVDTSTGETHQLFNDPSRELLDIFAADAGAVVWQPPSAARSVFLHTRDRTTMHQEVDRVELDTREVTRVNIPVLSLGDEDFLYFDAAHDSAAFVASSATKPMDVWATHDAFGSVKQLTHLNAGVERYVMGASRLVQWKSTDGQILRGTLILPAGYVAGRRYPTIVWQRPSNMGSQALDQYGLFSFENWQLLATRGYAILYPDYPNLAYGMERNTARTELLPALDELVNLGISDPNRFGLTGESWGGESTVAILTVTNRFKAALATVPGFVDLFYFYSQLQPSGDAFRVQEVEYNLKGKTPWNDRNLYIKRSPFFFLDRVHTPLLIMAAAAEGDETIGQHVGDSIFVSLRRLNQTVSYAIYQGGHGPSTFSYADRVDFWNRAIAWFDKYLQH